RGRPAHAAGDAREPSRRDRAGGRAPLSYRVPSRGVSRAAGAIRSRVGVPLLFVAALASPTVAETPPEARALLEHYHEDLGHLDRARDLLAAAAERQPDATVVTDLSRTWFLIGEFRARGDSERLAAYDRGREAGRRAEIGRACVGKG